MTRVLARFAQGLLVVLVAAFLAFFLIRSLPGDELSRLEMLPDMPAEEVARLRAIKADTGSTGAQYATWMTGVVSGNFGFSSTRNEPVINVLREHLPPTLLLMTLAFVASLAAGIALGTWQAFHRGSVGERVTSGIALTILSVPEFWLAIILLLLFALVLPWFPMQGMKDPAGDFSFFGALLDRIHHIVLPLLSLTLVDTAVISRYQRTAMQDVIGQHFLRTARAKGVPEQRIKWWHALRVSVLPTITIAGLFFPALFIGAVLIERVFAWPGLGSVLTKAIDERDHFLVAGIVIVGSGMTALGSFLADVAREIADPRLRT